jgi:hypothetical protein
MCECIKTLIKAGFIQQGNILDLKSGTSQLMPVLHAIKETKRGRDTVTTTWTHVRYCPNCGKKVKEETNRG